MLSYFRSQPHVLISLHRGKCVPAASSPTAVWLQPANQSGTDGRLAVQVPQASLIGLVSIFMTIHLSDRTVLFLTPCGMEIFAKLVKLMQ